MKRSGTLIFILAIFAALALICAVFPEDGVRVFGVQLRFPTLKEVLEPEHDASPQGLFGARRAARRAAELEDSLRLAAQNELASQRQLYEAFLKDDPCRFCLPEDDETFFDGFFDSLDSAMVRPVRILHYGDSQIEEDRITARLRERLQERFGGSGPGMLPLRRHFTRLVGLGTSFEMRRYLAYGDTSFRAGGSRYGPFADFVRLDTSVTVSVYPVKGRNVKPQFFNHATLVAGNLRSDLSARVSNDVATASSGEDLSLVEFELPDSTASIRMDISGHADLYGLLLDSDSGVSVDNIPMRGCSGELFTRLNAGQLGSFYEKAGVKMILLQYGGNSVPYLTSLKAISNYKASISRQIAHIRSLAPDALIVFIGPSDMSASIKGKRQTYPMLPSVVDSLRDAATESGAAYWSIYDAMGGMNSMISWVEASPALAGPDYIHFTTAGADKMGDLLADALMHYYEYYLWRKENE